MVEIASKNFQDQRIPDTLASQLGKALFEQLSNEKLYLTQERKIRANNQFTIIVFDRFTKEGRLKVEDQPDSMLLKNGELYLDAPTKNVFSNTPVNFPKKIFQQTGNTRKILNHLCKEYLSTDSTCRIWVTEALPSYINPGVRIGNIKGAVLAYEEKRESLLLKSEAIKIE